VLAKVALPNLLCLLLSISSRHLSHLRFGGFIISSNLPAILSCRPCLFLCLPRAAAVQLFGEHNMLLSPEPKHSYLRKLMQPAFGPEVVAGNLPRLEGVISTWMARWAAQEGPVKGYDELKSMTFDFILQVCAGSELQYRLRLHFTSLQLLKQHGSHSRHAHSGTMVCRCHW
jgi:cytochrome P450